MKTLLISLLLIGSQGFAKISELGSYKDLDLSTIDQNTLVIFDIDNTLLRQDSMIGTHQWGDYIRERSLRRGLSPQEAGDAQHKAFGSVQGKVSAVPLEEDEIRYILAYLQKFKISHFALTARNPALKNETLQQLKIFSHNFEKGFPAQKDPSALNPHLDQGVIFSGTTPKGELLKKILNNSDRKFSKIIFVDDRKYNLDSIETNLANSGIELVSLRYGGADQYVRDFNPQVADLVYSYFLETGLLISDSSASRFIGDLKLLAEARLQSSLGDYDQAIGCSIYFHEVDHQIYQCEYENFSKKFYKNFEFTKDAFTGGYYFGNW